MARQRPRKPQASLSLLNRPVATARAAGLRYVTDVMAGIGRRRVGQHFTYIGVDGTDALFERAKAAGAAVVREPFDTDYGSRDFTVRDPEGNLWMVGTYDPATTSSA